MDTKFIVDGREVDESELQELREKYQSSGKFLKQISETEFRTIQKLEG